MLIRVISLCLILCFSFPLHAHDQPIDTLLRNLLLNESEDIYKIAAKMIHAERISSTSVLDELAFRLDAGIQAQLNDDLLAWYAKALMFADTQRYIPKTKRRQKIGFKIKVRFEQNETKIARELERKGKFILATSRVDDSQLNAEEIIAVYRNRNQGIEGCLKFLKNKDLRLNQIFLKKESRIEYEKVSIPLYSDSKR